MPVRIRLLTGIVALGALLVLGGWALLTWRPALPIYSFGIPADDTLLLVAVATMSVVTLVAVLVTFYLYRWRHWMLSSKPYFAPEAWMARVKELEAGQERLVDTLAHVGRRTLSDLEEHGERVSDVASIVMKMQEALDEKDAEIRRLKRGYDAEVFRQFISRFIRLHRAIDEISASEETDRHDIAMIKRLCEDALEECGVETFVPETDLDYRRAEGVADSPEVVSTADPALDFTIADVKAPGYRLVTGESQEILREATVTIRRLEMHEETSA